MNQFEFVYHIKCGSGKKPLEHELGNNNDDLQSLGKKNHLQSIFVCK